MADILNQIDDAIRRNAARFDPLGAEAWDQDRVDRWGDGMRVRPASSAGIEEEAVPPEAAADSLELLTLEDVTPEVLTIRRRSPEGRHAYLADQRARHVANGAPEYWLAQFDALTEAAESAPADPVADAFRTEVLRQGLAPCEIEIDGRRAWLTAEPTVRYTGTFTPIVGVTTPGDPWSDIVDTYERIMANPHYEPSRQMTAAEASAFARVQSLSLECSRFLRGLCSGCDGLAMDGFPCVHDCHEPAVCSCPEGDVSAFGDRPRAQIARGYDPGCRAHAAPHVDAALQPPISKTAPRWSRIVEFGRRFLPGGTR